LNCCRTHDVDLRWQSCGADGRRGGGLSAEICSLTYPVIFFGAMIHPSIVFWRRARGRLPILCCKLLPHSYPVRLCKTGPVRSATAELSILSTSANSIRPRGGQRWRPYLTSGGLRWTSSTVPLKWQTAFVDAHLLALLELICGRLVLAPRSGRGGTDLGSVSATGLSPVPGNP